MIRPVAARWLFVVAVAVTALACDRIDAVPLQRINTDPMAHIELSSGILVRRTEQQAARVLGKPRRAQVLQVFTARNGITLENIQAEAESRASASGWRLSRRAAGLVEARRTIDGVPIELSIYRNGSTPELVILLRQQ